MLLRTNWTPEELAVAVKERLAQTTPKDIMQHTYNKVPLSSFSAFELCGIIDSLSLRLRRSSDSLAELREAANPSTEEDSEESTG